MVDNELIVNIQFICYRITQSRRDKFHFYLDRMESPSLRNSMIFTSLTF